jgi:hypothetical protein
MKILKEITKRLLIFGKKYWIPLTLIFFIMNLMTISWFIEDKRLNGGFYLFDYMTAHMERGKAVDLYYFMCDLSFGFINLFLIYPTAITLASTLITLIYHDIKSEKKHFFKCSFYALIVLIVLFTAFIAYPIADTAYWDDIASI